MEIRSFDGDAAPKIVEGRTIQGYAVVFNRESRIMFDKAKKRYFTVVICFQNCIFVLIATASNLYLPI